MLTSWSISSPEKRTSQQNMIRLRNYLKGELEWVSRMPKARGTKAKSRVDKFFDIKKEVYSRTSMSELQLTFPSLRLGSKIVEIHHVSKGYDELQLIKEFSYKFKKGEKVGIIGPNGSGKSTLLNLITQTIKPDEGKNRPWRYPRDWSL